MRSWIRKLAPLGLTALLLLGGCGGGGGSGKDNDTPAAPQIDSAPTALTVTEGQTATFNVAASGSGALEYQWLRNGTPIASANAASYTTPATATGDNGAKYSVTVSNDIGSTTSATATLTVTPLPRGTLQGRVISASTGEPVASAKVTVGSASANTDADGAYTIRVIAADRAVATVDAAGYGRAVRVANVLADTTTTLTLPLVPVGTAQALSVATGGDVAIAGSSALVRLPAAGLVRKDGGAAAANVTVALTAINPALDPNLMPGDFTALTEANGPVYQLESFGAILVEISDASGAQYNLAAGKTATIRIPLATRAPGTGIPATLPLWYMDETTGRWMEEGTATLQGTAPNQYYEGTVGHFSAWNADQVTNTVTLTGCVRDEANQPVANAMVYTDGIDYSGTSSARSGADGSFSVPIKRNGRATVTGLAGQYLTNSVSAGPSSVDFSLPACLVVSSTSPALNVKLTWGAAPEDVDSHLLLPTGEHVYYSNPGNLLAPTFASLDVDDIDSFGPEIVTLTKLYVGTYRYVVRNYSRTFDPGMTGSPVRVELNRSGALSIFNPPAGETQNDYWHVFDLVVDAQCRVNVVPVNSWSTTLPAAVVAPNAALCTP